MFRNLRIIFCVLAVICTAITVFIFAYFGIWGLIPLFGAIIFAVLMIICKDAQERRDKKNAPPPAHGDFITGRAETTDSDNTEN